MDARPDRRWWRGPAGIVLLWCILWSVVSVWNNSRVPDDDWRSEIRADAAGYYIYLPGTFHHAMRAHDLPDTLVERTAEGFLLDRARDRIITKYTYVTALLIAPFYLVAEVLTGFSSSDGLSPLHYVLLDVAGIVYWCTGLWLLWLALARAFPGAGWRIPAVLALASFGTGLFYYAFRAPGYAHVYGAFLASLALWAYLTGVREEPFSPKRWVLSGATALLVVQRPLDLLFALGLFGWMVIERPQLLKHVRWWAEAMCVVLLAVLPQLIYWKWVHGRWLVDSYAGEGFIHWSDPMLAEVLWSPHNGLVWFAPLFLAVLPMAFALRHERLRWLAWPMLLLCTYVYAMASWHSPHFGCAFGPRSLVTCAPVLAVMLVAWWHAQEEGASWSKVILVLVAAELALVNALSAWQWEVCYAGSGYWEWEPLWAHFRQVFSFAS